MHFQGVNCSEKVAIVVRYTIFWKSFWVVDGITWHFLGRKLSEYTILEKGWFDHSLEGSKPIDDLVVRAVSVGIFCSMCGMCDEIVDKTIGAKLVWNALLWLMLPLWPSYTRPIYPVFSCGAGIVELAKFHILRISETMKWKNQLFVISTVLHFHYLINREWNRFTIIYKLGGGCHSWKNEKV